MTEFILGYPKNKPSLPSSITQFSNVMDAASACSDAVVIYAKDMTEAKEKFIQLALNGFKPVNTVTGINIGTGEAIPELERTGQFHPTNKNHD